MSTQTDLPSTQSALLLNNPGPNNTVTLTPNIPLPTLNPQKPFLVKNTYAGVNFIDTYFRSGLYPAPTLLGLEGEGRIVSIHPSYTSGEFKVGDRVAFNDSKSFAEYAATSPLRALKLPTNIPSGHGAAMVINGLTAITLAIEGFPTKKGDIVLVTAAAGGTGAILVQYLSRVIGARVIAIASTKAKLTQAREDGAEWAFSYTDNNDWVSQIKSIPDVTSRGGVAAIFDSVGQATFDAALDLVAPKGSLISYGNASGVVKAFSLLKLKPAVKLSRPFLDVFVKEQHEWDRYTKELVRVVASGDVKIRIHKVYGFQEVDKAHGDLKSRGTTGKLLLKVE